MVKVCISGYYGFKNFGDEAILSVLIKHLGNLDITVFSSQPEFTSSTYGVKAIRSFDIKNVVKTIKNTDVLISGGGSLLQDVTSIKSLIYYLFIIALAIFFNKKVIIFAQGIGPVNNYFAQIIVRNILKLCTIVTVRDESSLELLNKWGVNANLVCDPVYSIDVPCMQRKNVIGIQIRDFKTMNYNLIHKLAMFVVAKFSDKKVEIFSLQETQDLEICKRFNNLLHLLNPDIETEIVTDKIIERISSLEYLIAMRFHAILCALKCGIKTCAINYDIKVEKLAKDAGLPIVSMDAHENFEDIYAQIQKLNNSDLLSFANSKSFDWSLFDDILFLIRE